MNIKHIAAPAFLSTMLLSSYAVAQVPVRNTVPLNPQTSALVGTGAVDATSAAGVAGVSTKTLVVGGGILAIALAGTVLAATLGGDGGGSGAATATATSTSR
jgi:hypothetical protein